MNRFWQDRKLVALLLATIVLRSCAVWFAESHLTDDRDRYLAIAQGIIEGHGYAEPGTSKPTAYRPPLYPLVLALGGMCFRFALFIGLLHIACGVLTVVCTVQIGRNIGLRDGAYVAGGLVAVDPLLIQYSALPMTETFFTMLVSLLLMCATSPSIRSAFDGLASRGAAKAMNTSNRRSLFLLGVMFGLCALCRPTIWVYGLIVGLWLISGVARAGQWKLFARVVVWPSILGVIVTVAPWCLRNAIVIQRPIFTTTHGGYTLLLGNNPVFYREVVEQPWGTVWREASLRRWQFALERQMRRENPPVRSEPDRDRWMYRRAWRHITEQPAAFVHACGIRFLRFWNVVPTGPARQSLPWVTVWGVGLYYIALTVCSLSGIRARIRDDRRRWMPLLLLILSFSAVHLLFWSNARMRAPLMPAVVLLAVSGATGRWQSWRSMKSGSPRR